MRNDYLSVLTLYIRLTYKKIIAVFAGMAGLEAILFHLRGTNDMNFADAAITSGLPFVTVAGLALISYVLIYSSGRGTKTVYTLARLNISLKKVFYMATVYFSAVYLLFWFIQASWLFMLSRYYIAHAPYEVEAPNIFISFLTSRYLMLFIPVRSRLLSLANIVMVIYAAIIAAISHFELIRGAGKGINGLFGVLIMALLAATITKPLSYLVVVTVSLGLGIMFNLSVRAHYDCAEYLPAYEDYRSYSDGKIAEEGEAA